MAVSPVRQACSLAVMLRISGPDPKSRKMRQHAFFQSKNGITTLSASGLCLPSPPPPNQLRNTPLNELLIITDASLVEPFLRQPSTQPAHSSMPELPSPFGPSSRGVLVRAPVQRREYDGGAKEELLPGTKIVALFDEESAVQGWQEGELVAVVDVPSATEALHSILSSHSSIDSGGWQLGWHLVSVDKAPTHQRPPPPPVRSAPTSSHLEAADPLTENLGHGFYSEGSIQGSGSGWDSVTSRKEVRDAGVAVQTRDSAPKPWSLHRSTVSEKEGSGLVGAPSRVRLAVLRVNLASARKWVPAKLQLDDPSKESTLRRSLLPAAFPTERMISSSALNLNDSRGSRDADAVSRGPKTEALFSNSPLTNRAHPQPKLVSAGPLRRGDFLAAVGSPFGALSPGHFANSVSVGVLSNWWHADENRAPILLADMRCLPGMEGGPVVDGSGGLVGLLWRPLRQRNSGAEVQLIITSDALAPALRPFGIDFVPRSSPLAPVAPLAASQAAASRPFEAVFTPSPQPTTSSGVNGQPNMGYIETLGSTARDAGHFGSDQVADPVNHQEILQMHPTSAAPSNRFSTAPSEKSPGKRPLREQFHTQKGIHTPDPITAHTTPFPAQLDMLERIHTPDGVQTPGGIHTSEGVPAAAESAAESVVLLSMDDGAWASGVVLSAEGLILTNAHLIEPWRFATKPKVHGSKLQPRVRFGASVGGVRGTGEESKEMGERLTGGEEGFREMGETEKARRRRNEGPAESPANERRAGRNGTERSEKDVGSGAASAAGSSAAGIRGGIGGAEGAGWPSFSGGTREALGEMRRALPELGSDSGGVEKRPTQRGAYWDCIRGSDTRSSATCQEQSEPASQPLSRWSGTEVERSGSAAESRDQCEFPPGIEYPERSLREGESAHSARQSARSLDIQTVAQRGSPRLLSPVYSPSPPPLSLRKTASNPPRYYRPVRVHLSDRGGAATGQSARVVFVSQGPFDAAVLQLLNAPTGLRPIVPAERASAPGATALVVGHGLFGPMTELRPSVYSGVVSRLVKSDGHVAMLQTTAAVHPGGSGGAVVDVSGRLIGLVTSAARHSGGSMLPHLNFSIPVEALKPVFDFANSGGLNVGLLEPLNTANSKLSAIWALAPPPPLPRPASTLLPGHILENLPGQEDIVYGSGKGTKFAQFLTDRGQDYLKKSTLLRSKL
ncbi:hypothetical protein KFL_000170110 [Klebsormidium nitens]|uniref:Uncharacterized protein n=1 Tax=Klebsormidium nitens TaxID=105231 RepID=A0A1Y1HJF7_KLENI|nr:hypothetical protein KFL_000170110 [Klebsormidium nitens]|eukprot:GAQ78665.1 hypothetical protein KFL_000170110 [Klebsormidium nitens]